jgi:hypothetical protein
MRDVRLDSCELKAIMDRDSCELKAIMDRAAKLGQARLRCALQPGAQARNGSTAETFSQHAGYISLAVGRILPHQFSADYTISCSDLVSARDSRSTLDIQARAPLWQLTVGAT